MLFQADPKLQREEAPGPETAPPDAIISPDTLRTNRVPPGQSRTRKWPVLDASGTPQLDVTRWRLRVGGLVNRDLDLSLAVRQPLGRGIYPRDRRTGRRFEARSQPRCGPWL